MTTETLLPRPLAPQIGPWDDEPDRVAWVDEATGYACLINRAPTMHHLCGYVAVPAGHPLHGVDAGSSWDHGYEGDGAHGGLSYGAAPGGNITNGDDEGLWWLGFDCAHLNDACPFAYMYGRGTYRTVAYVEQRCWLLARELADMARAGAAAGVPDAD